MVKLITPQMLNLEIDFTNSGATEATVLELIYKISDWLYFNEDIDTFSTPKITVKQRQQQISEVCYSY